ncbi:hypothetical protein L6164_006553 [Bauhinia variegata]|uniref:Uncharacterized protein n=1 Tax=Bauhinia variegata TaxID=167791 RepID=A0ACB9PUT9_BAUVA|nr:hypothetical protein L6164_006553 [Bauhinia variegata]
MLTLLPFNRPNLERRHCRKKMLHMRRRYQIEMDETEDKLRSELQNMQFQASIETYQSWRSDGWEEESNKEPEARPDKEASKSAFLDNSMEDIVKEWEKKWATVQENALKQPSPAQREKTLDKQLHSLIEQLATKQAQAEGLLSEIHVKEVELERLNRLWRRVESNNLEVNTTRNRFTRNSSDKGLALSDRLPYHSGSRNEHQEKLMLLRSVFVLYILALHIVVFIKVSF